MKDLLNNMRNANYSSWNALLTINGIFFSVFSVALISDIITNKLVLIILLLNIISIILLQFNYRGLKSFYYKMGHYSEKEVLNFTEKDKATEFSRAENFHRRMRFREQSTDIIFFIEIILLVIVLIQETL